MPAYKNLETRVGYRSSSSYSRPIKPPYKSRGEEVIAELLGKYKIPFKYEKQVCVEEKKRLDLEEKARLWYPDFYLEGLGIIIEYVGRTDDPDYMKGAEERRKTYEKMGAKLVSIYKEDVFDRGKLRPGFEQYLLNEIYKKVREGYTADFRSASINTNVIPNYRYSSQVYYN